MYFAVILPLSRECSASQACLSQEPNGFLKLQHGLCQCELPYLEMVSGVVAPVCIKEDLLCNFAGPCFSANDNIRVLRFQIVSALIEANLTSH